jgi:hypothetical protein
MSTLADIAVTGLSAAGGAFVVRAVLADWLPLWLLSKPFSCDLCMSWWGSVGFAAVRWGSERGIDAAWPILGGTAASMAVLKVVSHLTDIDGIPATLPDQPLSGDTRSDSKE